MVSEVSDKYDVQLTPITLMRNNYGYCSTYKNESLKWVRGGMLDSFGGVKYSYNSIGQRFKKAKDNWETVYCYDGKKLLCEDTVIPSSNLKVCKQSILYLYDNDGIAGFCREVRNEANNTYSSKVYYYVKDALGNVISIIDGYTKRECARYTYDAWGHTKVYDQDGNENTSQYFIGNINPIRWKSQYYDVESGLYHMDGRYYCAEAREYLNPLSPEEMFANADNPNVDAFKLTTVNPLAVAFITYTADTFREMVYDPKTMSGWEYFWNVKWRNFWGSPEGAIFAGWLFAVAIIVTVAASSVPCIGAGAWINFGITFGLALGGFMISAAVSGLRCAKEGGNFWDEVGNYITDNWSQTLAITSALYIVETALMIAASPNCFKEGTLVETEEGLKPIEEVQVGDKVLAYDEETGEQAYKKVVQLFRNQTNEWYHIFANGEEIVCTGGHPFYVAELDKFIPARELAIGTKLLLSTGVCAIIEAIQVEQLATPEITYNFEVEDFHTYYVTESKVLVHNMCKPESPERVKDSYLKKNNIDAHSLKREVLGNKSKDIAKFDIFRDKANNNRIWLGNKSQTTWHDTHYYFDDLITYFGGF